MPESESSQVSNPHFHKKIPSIFGNVARLKSQVSQGEGSSPTENPGAPSPIKLKNIFVGLLLGLVVLSSVSSAIFFYLKLRNVKQSYQESEKQIGIYRQAVLDMQKETKNSGQGTEDIKNLKLELQESKNSLEKTREEQNLVTAKLETLNTDLEKEKMAKEEFKKNVEKLEKIKKSLEEETARLKSENAKFLEEVQRRTKASQQDSSFVLSGKNLLEAHIIVVKPQVSVGVIDLGSQDGITSKMVLNIYDENNLKVGEFVAVQVDELFSSGSIHAKNINEVKPGMRVCQE